MRVAGFRRRRDDRARRFARRRAGRFRHHSSPAKTRMAFVRARGYTAQEKTSQGFRGGVRFMADGSKRVFFVNGPAHPIFTEIVEKRADIRLDRLKNDSADDVATPVL